MNALFAKLSMSEIRSRQGLCAAAACSKPCHNGRVTESASAAAEGGWMSTLLSWGKGASSSSASASASTSSTDFTWLPGCPMNAAPGLMVDNSQCVMCGYCLRACTSGSAQWRLRPPAADLYGDHAASWSEVSLMWVLLGSVALHR
jgi:heterodisulfide reductase subunit A-like polyferredoxin